MKYLLKLIAILFIGYFEVGGTTQECFAQHDSTQIDWVIKSTENKVIKGRLIQGDSVRFTIVQQNGDTVNVPLSMVKRVYPFFSEHLHSSVSSKYFFGNNALGLVKGEGYYSNTLLVNNEIGYGLTKWLAAQINCNPFIVDGRFYLSALCNLDIHVPVFVNKLSLGLKLNAGKIWGFEENKLHFTGYEVYFTLGNREANLTLSIADRLVEDVSEEYINLLRAYFLGVRSMFRISNRSYFLLTYDVHDLEQHTIFNMYTVGVKTVWKTISLTYGIGFNHVTEHVYGSPQVEDDIYMVGESFPYPWLSFSKTF